MPKNLHHMPDVITTECEQHGKTIHCFSHFISSYMFFFIGFSSSIKHFPFLNIHYVSFVAFQFNSIEFLSGNEFQWSLQQANTKKQPKRIYIYKSRSRVSKNGLWKRHFRFFVSVCVLPFWLQLNLYFIHTHISVFLTKSHCSAAAATKTICRRFIHRKSIRCTSLSLFFSSFIGFNIWWFYFGSS